MTDNNLVEIAKQVPPHIFRGYDLRGVVGTELTSERVYAIGRGYATWLLRRRIYDCVVGHDCRLSSPEYKEVLVQALNDAGITVYDIGMTLSQITYFSQYYFRTKGAVMITASHNPPEFNGFKFGVGFSDTMTTDEMVELRDLVIAGKFTTLDKKGEHIKEDVFKVYADDLFKRVGKINKFKVIVDCCAATPGAFMPEILRRAGCEVIEQNCTPDGHFPVGNANPIESFVFERVAKRVKEEGADLAFSYDCDGDRVGIVDQGGNMIWNDTLAAIFAKDLLDFAPGAKIVYNNLCSKQVDEVIRQSGGVPVIWKTGHSFIKAKVKEERAIFGGELSGHFFFMDNFYGHDDGAMASLRLLAYLSRVGKSLKQVVSELPQYIPSPYINLFCIEDKKSSVMSEITSLVKEALPGASFNEIDGIRADTEKEMLTIRPSQNGPYLAMKFEAKDAESFENLRLKVKNILVRFEEFDFHHPTINTNVEILLK